MAQPPSSIVPATYDDSAVNKHLQQQLEACARLRDKERQISELDKNASVTHERVQEMRKVVDKYRAVRVMYQSLTDREKELYSMLKKDSEQLDVMALVKTERRPEEQYPIELGQEAIAAARLVFGDTKYLQDISWPWKEALQNLELEEYKFDQARAEENREADLFSQQGRTTNLIEQKDRRISELEAQLKESQRREELHRRCFLDTNGDYVRQLNENEDLEKQLTALRTNAETRSREIRDLSEALTSEKTQAETLKREIAQLIEQSDRDHGRIGEQMCNLWDYEFELDGLRTEMASEREQARLENHCWHDTYEELKTEVSELSKQRDALRTSNRLARADFSAADKKAREDTAGLADQLEKCEVALLAAEEFNSRLWDDAQENKGVIDTLRIIQKQSDSELQRRICEHKSQTEANIASFKATETSLRTANTELTTALRTVNKQLGEQRSKNVALDSEVTRLNEQHDADDLKLRESREEAKQLRSEAEEALEGQISELSAEVAVRTRFVTDTLAMLARLVSASVPISDAPHVADKLANVLLDQRGCKLEPSPGRPQAWRITVRAEFSVQYIVPDNDDPTRLAMQLYGLIHVKEFGGKAVNIASALADRLCTNPEVLAVQVATQSVMDFVAQEPEVQSPQAVVAIALAEVMRVIACIFPSIITGTVVAAVAFLKRWIQKHSGVLSRLPMPFTDNLVAVLKVTEGEWLQEMDGAAWFSSPRSSWVVHIDPQNWQISFLWKAFFSFDLTSNVFQTSYTISGPDNYEDASVVVSEDARLWFSHCIRAKHPPALDLQQLVENLNLGEPRRRRRDPQTE